MPYDQSFSPSEILSGGSQGQPAMRLLSFIESRTAYLMAQVQRAIAILLNLDAQSISP